MYFLVITIVIFWLFSIFTFATWQSRASLQTNGMRINPASDWATKLFLKVTSVIMLLLIFYIIRY